jgi:CHASE3 domain sensor protein
VPVVVLVLVGLASFVIGESLRATNAVIKETDSTLIWLDELHVDLLDAETGLRGFVITGDPAFLEPYEAAVRKIDTDFEALRGLATDDPLEQERIQTMHSAMQDEIKEMREIIEKRRLGGFEAAASIVRNGSSRGTMDRILAIHNDIRKKELDDLRDDDAESIRTVATIRVISIGGIGATIAIVVVLGFAMVRGIRRQIGTAAQQMQTSVNELQAAATQQAHGAKEQATTSTEVSTTMKDSPQSATPEPFQETGSDRRRLGSTEPSGPYPRHRVPTTERHGQGERKCRCPGAGLAPRRGRRRERPVQRHWAEHHRAGMPACGH